MAGELLAAQMTERSLAIYKVPVYKLYQAADALALTDSEVLDGMNLDLAANVLLLQGEVSNSETETSGGAFQFTLPPEYVAAGDIQLRLKAANIGGGTQTSCTITVTAYLSDGNGAVGANLGPVAQTHAAKTTWYTKDFVITATGLSAGDTLNIDISVANIEGAGTNLIWTCDEVAMLLDVQ